MEFLGAASAGTLAAFDADGTLWDVDVGETFLKWAGEQGKLPRWPKGPWAWVEYERRLATGDLRYAFEFCMTAFADLPEKDVIDWAAALLKPMADAAIFPEMRALVKTLHAREAEVWIVSGSPTWCVIPCAALLGVPPERVIAGEAAVDEAGRVTDALRAPLTIQETKVSALLARAGRPPHFAAGNSTYDYDLIESARAVSLLVNPPDDDSWRSRRNGESWLIQRWERRKLANG